MKTFQQAALSHDGLRQGSWGTLRTENSSKWFARSVRPALSLFPRVPGTPGRMEVETTTIG